MGARRHVGAVLVLALILACAGPAAGEERPARMPFAGLSALDPFAEADRKPARLEHFVDLGGAFVRTTPIRWGVLEPAPPRSGPPRYEWNALDEAVLVWQLSGLDPVLVLSPASRWGAQPAEQAAWPRRVRDTLPAAEALAVLRSATGAAPPRPGRWKAWERFVRDVVERYDGDGKADMPGLRRPVRHVQVLARLTASAWIGSVEDYMRLLHHAGVGAKSAAEGTRVLAAAVDLHATGHAPHPDRREWDFRIGRLVPADAKLARLEIEREFAFTRRLLEMTRLYDVFAHVGSGHHADDVANLRFLRRHLDEHGGRDTALWLVDNPTRKLGTTVVPGVVQPKPAERKLRARHLPAANPGDRPRDARSRAWLRLGQAFDLVRSYGRARAAGADVVLFLAPWDRLPRTFPDAGAARCLRQGFVAEALRAAPAAGLRRTPSWWALRQMQRLLRGHRSAGETAIGAPGRSVIFRLDAERTRPWVAVLMLDPRLSWAGTPGEALPVRDVLVPLPSGHYVVESLRLGPEAPARRRIEVKDGMVRLALTPAPVYVIPTEAPPR